MDWHLVVPLVLLPLALFSQLRTRRVNALALLCSPLIYAVLTVRLAVAVHTALLAVAWPALLVLAGLLGFAQGRATQVFYDPALQNYRQRGGSWPLAYWLAALLLRQGAAMLLAHGLTAAQARDSTALTVDAVLTGLLAGRAIALMWRHPGLWAVSAAQLRGELVVPPPAGPPTAD